MLNSETVESSECDGVREKIFATYLRCCIYLASMRLSRKGSVEASWKPRHRDDLM